MIQEPIRCREMVEIVTDWMEGGLDGEQRAAIEAHLAICPDCTTYLDQLRTASTLAARLADAGEPMPDETRARLLAAFRASRPD